VLTLSGVPAKGRLPAGSAPGPDTSAPSVPRPEPWVWPRLTLRPTLYVTTFPLLTTQPHGITRLLG